MATATMISMPVQSKKADDIEAGIKSRLGPGEQFSWTRADDVHELNVALENCGGQLSGVPHSPNSNFIERFTLTFGDL